ncbi:hypothetical protein FlaCF_1767 [Flavobacterium tructae]
MYCLEFVFLYLKPVFDSAQTDSFNSAQTDSFDFAQTDNFVSVKTDTFDSAKTDTFNSVQADTFDFNQTGAMGLETKSTKKDKFQTIYNTIWNLSFFKIVIFSNLL